MSGMILATAAACIPPQGPASTPTTTLPHGACAAGSYSTTGNEPCSPAPPGFYVDAVGAHTPTPCAVGSYQPSIGQTSCLLAPIGFHVDATAQNTPTPCPPTTTTTAAGADSLSDCVQVPVFSFTRTVGWNTTSTTSVPFATAVTSGVTASVTINCSATGPITEPWGGAVLAHVLTTTLTDIGTLPGQPAAGFSCGVSYPLTMSAGPLSFGPGDTLNVSTDLIPPPGTSLTFTVLGDLGGAPTQVL